MNIDKTQWFYIEIYRIKYKNNSTKIHNVFEKYTVS